MKLCLIFSLYLSLGIADKLDRTYLPPEGSLQSSGVASDLKLPYHDLDNNNKMDIGFPHSKFTDPTDTKSLFELQKLNSKNIIYPDGFQNTKYFGDNTSTEKEAIDDGLIKENGHLIYDPIVVTEHPLYSSNFNNYNGSEKPDQLNPYLPLKMQVYQSTIASSKINNDSDKLNTFDVSNKDNIEGTITPPSNDKIFNLRNNMTNENLVSNLSMYSSDNNEKKSELKFATNNNENITPKNNVNDNGSVLLHKNENIRKTTDGLSKNIGLLNKDFKTLPIRPSRPQAENDKNAVILSYDNSITPEDGTFAFSFDTSNGIHVDEHGTSNGGVKAEGGYSYTGDDGKVYTIRYTADENGFQPNGDHLPTPPPIPEAILKVIELAMKNKEDNVSEDDGMYDDKKYGYQNYDRNFVDKYKKPHSILPSKLTKYESKPGSSRTVTRNQPSSFGDKKSGNRVSDIKPIISNNAPGNVEYELQKNKNNFVITNGDQERNKGKNYDYIPHRPTISRYGIHRQPFSQQTAVNQPNKSELYMKEQNNRIPNIENIRISGNEEFKNPDEVETKLYFPTMDFKLDTEPNRANNRQPQLSFVSGEDAYKEKGNFKTQPSFGVSTIYKPFDIDSNLKENYKTNMYYNAPGIYETSTIINPNIYVNNPRADVLKVNYETKHMVGYHYPTPTRTYSMNTNIPDLINDSQKDVEISIPKTNQGHMFHEVKTERPINRGNYRPNMEKLVKLAKPTLEGSGRPVMNEYFIPNFKNEGTTGNLQSFPLVGAAPENVQDVPDVNLKDSRRKPPLGANTYIYHDDINVEQSDKAVGNPETVQGQDFSGPKQKPYFDPDSGYH